MSLDPTKMRKGKVNFMTLMKKMKRAAAAVAFALVTVLLCSCVDMEMGIMFHDDGGAKVYMDLAMEDETLKSMEMTPEEAAASLMEQMDEEAKDWKAEPLTRTIDSKTYSGMRYYREFTAAEVNEDPDFFESSDESISISLVKEGGATKVNIKMSTGEAESAENAEQMSSMMNFRFRLTPPAGADIVNTNGIKDSDGSVYWDLMDVACGKVKSIDMTLEYKVVENYLATILIIVGIAVVVGAAAAVIIVLINKNKTPALPKISLETYDMPAPEQNNNFVQPAAPVQPEPEREMAEVPEAPAEMPAAVMPTAPAKPAESSDTDEENGYFQTSDAVKYCPACGAEAPVDAGFCSACGKVLK